MTSVCIRHKSEQCLREGDSGETAAGTDRQETGSSVGEKKCPAQWGKAACSQQCQHCAYTVQTTAPQAGGVRERVNQKEPVHRRAIGSLCFVCHI